MPDFAPDNAPKKNRVTLEHANTIGHPVRHGQTAIHGTGGLPLNAVFCRYPAPE